MNITNSFDFLIQNIINHQAKQCCKVFVILIGGCSRSGKSTLTKLLVDKLTVDEQKVVSLNLDSWLLSVDKRKEGSNVSERYNVSDIYIAINNLLKGETVIPPVYDYITRKQTPHIEGEPKNIKSGILIIEGVIALSLNELINKSHYNIYVETTNCLRIKRLIDFYGAIKNLPKYEYKTLILNREKEETPFIRKTAVNANIIFYCNNILNP